MPGIGKAIKGLGLLGKKGWLKKELQKKSTQSFKSLMKELKTDWKKRTGPSGKK